MLQMQSDLIYDTIPLVCQPSNRIPSICWDTIHPSDLCVKRSVTVFLRPLSPCDLVRAESQPAALAVPFRPSPLRHKRHGANWAPNIRCSNHTGCCVAWTFHLLCSVFSRSLLSVFHMLVASMVPFPCFKWVAIRRAQIAVEGFYKLSGSRANGHRCPCGSDRQGMIA
jgi:hypothetical protein